MTKTLAYASQAQQGKSRLGFAVASIVVAPIAGVIALSFHFGVFDNYKYGDDWFGWGVAGFGLSLGSLACAGIGLNGRHRKLAIIAIVLSAAVFVYGIASPMPKNIPMP